jgi:putative transposase
MAGGLQGELRLLGIEGSPALVRAPEGNGRAGRLIRTLEEDPLRARTSDAVEELGQALPESRETRNTARPIAWPIERHGFRPPSAVRQGQLSTAAIAA